MGNPVVHFEIGGKNAEKMREFYGGLFDWEFEECTTSWAATPRSAVGDEAE